MQTENSSLVGGDSDDDFDWEEVDVPQQDQVLPLAPEDQSDIQEAGPSNDLRPHIEITIQAKPKPDEAAKKKAAAIQAERVARVNCHKMHTVALLGNARIRNHWINDPLLHARLMSLTPLALQNAFSMIHKSRIPEAAKRGRLFESAITRLAEWWSNTFEIEPVGHIRSRTWEEVKQKLLKKQDREKAEMARDPKGKGKAKAVDFTDDYVYDDEDEAEIIRSEKSLMKHALMRRGSRDTSAQLFTALCRALGIPARLVVSLQSVPWQANVGKPKPTGKKKKTKDEKGSGDGSGITEEKHEDEDDDMDMEEVEIPSSPAASVNGKGKAFPGGGERLDEGSTPSTPDKGKKKAPPVIKLRKSKGRKLGSAPPEKQYRRERTPDPITTPPVFWTEVFSRADARWLPVDPIRCIVNKRKAFDPTPSQNAATRADRNRPVRVENRMVYVVAFEEDSYARDVTPRYAREYGAKVAKIQQGGKGRQQWWERILSMVHRPYRLNRDDLEDEELHINQMTEQMPTSMIGFKDHPLYVLARHLKRDEVIHPLNEIGKFRGEPVYSRSSVLLLKTAENWMRQGRKVREGCQPMKWVKQHAVTINKKRAIEMAMMDGKDLLIAGEGLNKEGFASEKDVMQGLYAESQTELYKPDPVIDGKVPRNDFGNIDLYVPSMLPAGGAYIPYKGAAKIARQLGFDYAEAVTGFEFKKRRAFPVISGVVVATENEEVLLEAYWAAEHEAEKKRHAKRQEQVIKRWTRLIQGLRIRQRLQEQYKDRGPVPQESEGVTPAEREDEHPHEAGGFLTGADDVVQHYTLPRDLHEAARSPVPSNRSLDNTPGVPDDGDSQEITAEVGSETTNPAILEVINDSEGEDMLEVSVKAPKSSMNGIPKTMQQLAEDLDAERQRATESPKDEEVEYLPSPGPSSVPLPPKSLVQEKLKGRTTKLNVRSTRSGTTTPISSSAKKGRGAAKSAAKRGRKRTRDDDSEPSDEEIRDVEEEIKPSPTKRARATRPPPLNVKSDRVLRTRTSKSANKIQEEKEMEQAYRRATAE